MVVLTNVYPHNWTYQLNFVKGPFTDLRVRRAAELRDQPRPTWSICSTAWQPRNTPPFRRRPRITATPMIYKFDPAKATALLKEANCYPCAIKLAISTSGSGQMQPLPMNELVKSQLEAVGFKVDFDVMDWNALGDVSRGGVDKFPDISGINVSRALQDPFYALIRHVAKSQWAPAGSNWGHYEDADTESLITQITSEFDPEKQNALLEKLNERMNEQAVMIWVVHGREPARAVAKSARFRPGAKLVPGSHAHHGVAMNFFRPISYATRRGGVARRADRRPWPGHAHRRDDGRRPAHQHRRSRSGL